MFVDSHCHIEDDETALRAGSAGVGVLLNAGKDLDEAQAQLLMCARFDDLHRQNPLAPKMWTSVGVHPDSAPEKLNKIQVEDIVKAAQHPKVIAIGECGLDYHYDTLYKEEQKKALEEQIKLSIKYDLPLVIHSRDAISDTYNILKKYPKAYGVMHCYSGSKEMALEFLKLGFYISLGGPVTFKNARVPKEVAEVVPLDKLLIETLGYIGESIEPGDNKQIISDVTEDLRSATKVEYKIAR